MFPIQNMEESKNKKIAQSLFMNISATVDACSGGVNLSKSIESVITEYGGKINKIKPTHFVFMNGDINRLKRAVYKGVKIVSPLWVDDSIKLGQLQDEEKYRPKVDQRIADDIAEHNLKRKAPKRYHTDMTDQPTLYASGIFKRAKKSGEGKSSPTILIPFAPESLEEYRKKLIENIGEESITSENLKSSQGAKEENDELQGIYDVRRILTEKEKRDYFASHSGPKAQEHFKRSQSEIHKNMSNLQYRN